MSITIVAEIMFNGSKSSPDAGFKPSGDDEKKVDKDLRKDNEINAVGRKTSIELPDDPNMSALEDIVYLDDNEDDGAEADMNNLDTTIQVSPIPTTRIYKDHPLDQVIGDLQSTPQTRRMSKNLEEHGFLSTLQQRTNHKDLQNCLFACFLSQEEPKKMDVKSALLYGKIEEEVYVCQLLGFEGSGLLERVYNVEKALLGLHQAPRAWTEVKQKEDVIFISQGKYVTEILKKFSFTDVKTTSTPMETQNHLLKDEDVCACTRYQVNPKVSHLHVVKRIFRYLKGQLKLGLWYPKDSSFDLVAYTDSDYVRASLDRKSTIGDMHNINPTIYTLCIEQFWATAKVKTVNGEVRLQALVDGKKIIITEASIRCDLQLNDEEGTDCLPNATIFEELTRMGNMASAIICLATNQKFNFSKYIFESMVKNLGNVSGKFLMYPRFVQVFLEKQLEGMSNHKRIYVTPSHTKKIFRNMRRVGKGFSGRETPLFPTMMVQAQEEIGEGSANPNDLYHKPTIIQPSISQPQLKQRSRRPKRKDTEVPRPSGPTNNITDEAVYEEMNDSLERAATTATCLDAEQDSGNINKTQSKATPNEPSSLGTSLGGGPRSQETMGNTIARTRFKNVSKTSNDSLLTGVNTPRSDEDRLKINEGRIVGIKRLHDDLEVTAAKVYVTDAKLNLVLFINFNEKYAK
ncbi:putative ribonuclease H-like domain-containing protein [Tanacetum coccineum]